MPSTDAWSHGYTTTTTSGPETVEHTTTYEVADAGAGYDQWGENLGAPSSSTTTWTTGGPGQETWETTTTYEVAEAPGTTPAADAWTTTNAESEGQWDAGWNNWWTGNSETDTGAWGAEGWNWGEGSAEGNWDGWDSSTGAWADAYNQGYQEGGSSEAWGRGEAWGQEDGWTAAANAQSYDAAGGDWGAWNGSAEEWGSGAASAAAQEWGADGPGGSPAPVTKITHADYETDAAVSATSDDPGTSARRPHSPSRPPPQAAAPTGRQSEREPRPASSARPKLSDPPRETPRGSDDSPVARPAQQKQPLVRKPQAISLPQHAPPVSPPRSVSPYAYAPAPRSTSPYAYDARRRARDSPTFVSAPMHVQAGPERSIELHGGRDFKLDQAMETNTALNMEMDGLREANARLLQSNAALREDLEMMDTVLEMNNKLKQDLQKYHGFRNQDARMAEDLKSRLAASGKQNQQLRETLGGLQQTMSQTGAREMGVIDRLRASEDENVFLRASLRALDEEVKDLKDMIKAITVGDNDPSRRLAELSLTHQQKLRQMGRMRRDLDEIRTAVDRLVRANRGIAGSLQRRKATILKEDEHGLRLERLVMGGSEGGATAQDSLTAALKKEVQRLEELERYEERGMEEDAVESGRRRPAARRSLEFDAANGRPPHGPGAPRASPPPDRRGPAAPEGPGAKPKPKPKPKPAPAAQQQPRGPQLPPRTTSPRPARGSPGPPPPQPPRGSSPPAQAPNRAAKPAPAQPQHHHHHHHHHRHRHQHRQQQQQQHHHHHHHHHHHQQHQQQQQQRQHQQPHHHHSHQHQKRHSPEKAVEPGSGRGNGVVRARSPEVPAGQPVSGRVNGPTRLEPPRGN